LCETQKWVNLPLPFGPKARLIQIHLDTQAKLHDRSLVELEGSMTSLIKQLQGRSRNGPELRKLKGLGRIHRGGLFRFAAAKVRRAGHSKSTRRSSAASSFGIPATSASMFYSPRSSD
jgi:hypothetical protein